MTTNAVSPITSSKSPCGCSGSGTSSPCSCGGGGCQSCQSQGFIRPLFFAGQLLTEDDLQSLTDYVAGKNRLHNRYFFGDGAVCGLQVTRNPCTCGQVIVNPGYALDCCGNDIVVACPQPLDINKMVRELMLKLRNGHDCGDPCPDKTATNPTANSRTMAQPADTTAGSSQSADKPKKYCLYIDYCEQSTDPVTPYATDNPCSAQPVCQPTRVHEGFRFELRCPEPDDCQPEICKRLCACLGPATEKVVTANYSLLRKFATSVRSALQKIQNGVPPRISVENLTRAVAELTKFSLEKDLSEADLQSLTERLRNAAVAFAPFVTAKLTEKDPAKEASLKDELNAIERYAAFLRTARSKLENPLWRSYAEAITELAALFRPAHRDRLRSDKLPDGEESSAPNPELLLLSYGAVVTQSHMKNCIVALREMRAWLAERAQQSPAMFDAKDAQQPSRLSDFVLERPLVLRSVGAVAEEIYATVNRVRHSVKGCICNALIPPCHSCNDPGVLLACVTVQDCCVVEICNLERKFVLSSVALRYWIPELQELGESIEELCCPSGCEDDEDEQDSKVYYNEDDGSLFDVLGDSPAFARAAVSTLLRGCCTPAKRRGSAFPQRLQQSAKVLLSHSAPGEPAAASFSSSVFAEAVRPSDVEELVKKAVADTRESLDSTIAELGKLKTDHARLLERVAKWEKKQSKSGSDE
jgi:hypothetical protein